MINVTFILLKFAIFFCICYIYLAELNFLLQWIPIQIWGPAWFQIKFECRRNFSYKSNASIWNQIAFNPNGTSITSPIFCITLSIYNTCK